MPSSQGIYLVVNPFMPIVAQKWPHTFGNIFQPKQYLENVKEKCSPPEFYYQIVVLSVAYRWQHMALSLGQIVTLKQSPLFTWSDEYKLIVPA